MKVTRRVFLKVGSSTNTDEAVFSAARPKKNRRFDFKTGAYQSRRPVEAPTDTIHSSPGQVKAVYEGQRQRYKRYQETLPVSDEPGSFFTPVSPKYGLYDGIDSHALGNTSPSPEERRRRLQEALEEGALSSVEFTEGGEADIDLNGLPESEYHGKDGWTTIPKDSALYASLYRGDLDSRKRHNSWSAVKGVTKPSLLSEEDSTTLDGNRRRRLHDEGSYSPYIEGELIEPVGEMISQPRSTYGLRKMFVDGLLGYTGMVSRAEEAAICQELMTLLQDGRAAYIAEESRYCVNLYERELETGRKDTLAFSIDRAPTLQKVLERFFFLGLIPSPPNVCQVSEMVGNFSGYPVHRKPTSIGSYCGMLNLLSASVLHLQHCECPWFPRVYLHPRSLYVVTNPCLQEYAMGYKQTHQPFHNFDYATRVSKDYRIEVLFATVEVEHSKHLHQAIQLSDYATQLNEKKLLPVREEEPQPVDTIDTNTGEWVERLRERLHASEKDGATPIHTERESSTVDGNYLREQLLQKGKIGHRTKEFEVKRSGSGTSEAVKRMAALKARYERSQKQQEQKVERSSGGPTLIRGHSPRDRK